MIAASPLESAPGNPQFLRTEGLSRVDSYGVVSFQCLQLWRKMQGSPGNSAPFLVPQRSPSHVVASPALGLPSSAPVPAVVQKGWFRSRRPCGLVSRDWCGVSWLTGDHPLCYSLAILREGGCKPSGSSLMPSVPPF